MTDDALFEYEGCGAWIWDDRGSRRCGEDAPCPIHDPDDDEEEVSCMREGVWTFHG